MPNPVRVVAGILIDPAGRILLASRPEGRTMAGYWEFPGGKIEPGETPIAALKRELWEELGITCNEAIPWLSRSHRYFHAHVVLDFFKVSSWDGLPQPCEGQKLHWHSLSEPCPSPLLPANAPLIKWLQLPSVYAITEASARGMTKTLQDLHQALVQGLRLIQVREKTMPRAIATRFLSDVMDLARPWGATVMLNGETQAEHVTGLQGLHLTSSQLSVLSERPHYPWVAASCHNQADLQRAAELGLDFVVLGPVRQTPSHPDSPPLGWTSFCQGVQVAGLPTYALGGMQAEDLPCTLKVGAQGVAMLRGWQSMLLRV